jgi:hypothetical protein
VGDPVTVGVGYTDLCMILTKKAYVLVPPVFETESVGVYLPAVV